VTEAVQHRSVLGREHGGGLARQAGFADARLALDQDHRRRAADGGEQQAQLPLPADEGETVAAGRGALVGPTSHAITFPARPR
jgi:hypothetical protein